MYTGCPKIDGIIICIWDRLLQEKYKLLKKKSFRVNFQNLWEKKYVTNIYINFKIFISKRNKEKALPKLDYNQL